MSTSEAGPAFLLAAPFSLVVRRLPSRLSPHLGRHPVAGETVARVARGRKTPHARLSARS
ncbi:hypothetical protein ACFY0F_38360 [Streptomyces sp. NPDC001544]|uniref:hypothetical protein n=1 Tax=Streptomyces sp. NPDC001544 TaxID=3364584 RepID=UPI0036B38E30